MTHIRSVTPDDLAAVTAIYAWHVVHGTGTFELDPPDQAEMQRRHANVVDDGLPWLVAERGGTVIGYAYATRFRPRPAYAWCLEDSIYIAPTAQGTGVGRALLTALLAASEAIGARQMLAVIGDAENHASIGLHRALGFTDGGVLRAAGWKHGRWLDVVLLQRALGAGDSGPP